jgi:hypothetical protein
MSMNVSRTCRCIGLVVPASVAIALTFLLGSPERASALDAETCQAGRQDNFTTADGVEAATPSSALMSAIHAVTTEPLRPFDACVIDGYFAHTVTGCGLDSTAESVRLTLQLRGVGSQANTDLIYFAVNGVFRWGLRMNTLQSLRTGGADPSWSNGDVGTFVLELGALPASDTNPSYGPRYPAGVTSILGVVLQAGSLDVILADDTCVDYLTVEAMNPTPVAQRSWGAVKVRHRRD